MFLSSRLSSCELGASSTLGGWVRGLMTYGPWCPTSSASLHHAFCYIIQLNASSLCFFLDYVFCYAPSWLSFREKLRWFAPVDGSRLFPFGGQHGCPKWLRCCLPSVHHVTSSLCWSSTFWSLSLRRKTSWRLLGTVGALEHFPKLRLQPRLCGIMKCVAGKIGSLRGVWVELLRQTRHL